MLEKQIIDIHLEEAMQMGGSVSLGEGLVLTDDVAVGPVYDGPKRINYIIMRYAKEERRAILLTPVSRVSGRVTCSLSQSAISLTAIRCRQTSSASVSW